MFTAFSLAKYIFTGISVVKSRPYALLLGQRSVFLCKVTLHMHSVLIPKGQEHTEGTTRYHLFCSRQTLKTNQHSDLRHEAVVKWISLWTTRTLE